MHFFDSGCWGKWAGTMGWVGGVCVVGREGGSGEGRGRGMGRGMGEGEMGEGGVEGWRW